MSGNQARSLDPGRRPITDYPGGIAERNRPHGASPPPRPGADAAAGRLLAWCAGQGRWLSCPPEEITWLDRALLSGNTDLTLHRAPRCAGLRHVHHRWELFSRDPTHRVYLARNPGHGPLDPKAVRVAAERVLPVAPAAHYETLPVVLEAGDWLISVGGWVLPIRLDAPARRETLVPGGVEQPPTQEVPVRTGGSPVRRGGQPRRDAVAHVRAWFERNPAARLAMAYHYQEFILGAAAPQPVPMTDVVVALDLSGEGAVSDYKKLLQGFIWSERGHPRELPEFLLSHGLLTHADLHAARRAAADNERSGRSEMARQRLRYRQKKKSRPAGSAG